MPDAVQVLPHLNALLNGLATVLLLAGYVLIKRRRETAHKRTMIACFVVSTMFLACYLVYHALAGSRKFPDDAPDGVRYAYLTILLTHVVLAMAVPPLAISTIVMGLLDRRAAHRRLARWTFPIWMYVSISGVAVYVMLYQIFPPDEVSSIVGG